MPEGGWVTRCAPSPTGLLHVGHVAHAEWVWGLAEAVGARIVLRMEDHDRSRCRPEYEAAILADLAWTGFAVTPEALGALAQRPSPVRQSDHPERYAAAIERLRTVARIYPCRCTRAAMGPPDAHGERRHDDGCRRSAWEASAEAALRVELPDTAVTWQDLTHGPQREYPWRQVGDTLLRDAMGQWSYQFCVVVDDLHDGVNLVIRGDDLRASTGRQVLLGQLLGRTTPVVVQHHPLVYGPDGQKLSKRDRSETVQSLRERGLSAAEVRGRRGGGPRG